MGNDGHHSRRRFLRAAGIVGAALASGGEGGASAAASQRSAEDSALKLPPLPMTKTGPDRIPHRALGRAAATVSILGVGGHHLGDMKTPDEAVNLVHEAVDAGITFFD